RSLIDALLWSGRDAEADHRVLVHSRLVEDLNQPFVSALSLLEKSRRAKRLGQDEESVLHLERAIERFESLGSDRGLCWAKLLYGPVHFENALAKIALLRQAREHCAAIGLADGEALALHHLAEAWRDEGEYQRAFDHFRDSATILGELGDQRGIAQGRVGLAVMFSIMGRLNEAMRRLEEALAWFRQDHESGRLMGNLMIAAGSAIPAGRVEDAAAWIEEAATHGPSGGSLLELYELRCQLALARGDPSALRAALGSLREHNRNINSPYFESVARGYEASLAELEGEWETARRLLAALGPRSEHGGRLVRLHLRAGKHAEARRALRGFRAWVESSPEQQLRWLSRVVEAEVMALDRVALDRVALDRIRRAADQLRQVEREARVAGHRAIALEAAVARGRILAQTQLLEKARDEARSRGLLRLAQEASRALGIEELASRGPASFGPGSRRGDEEHPAVPTG
ncbi:MAG: tetratricopeptide repeat protein, partial [Holophagales bacterium]|nr:tetratricopeptide repeat protein [Holophagales bacterium]